MGKLTMTEDGTEYWSGTIVVIFNVDIPKDVAAAIVAELECSFIEDFDGSGTVNIVWVPEGTDEEKVRRFKECSEVASAFLNTPGG
jgi:hypothetical protein